MSIPFLATLLEYLGFFSIGPVAGSLAAWFQAAFYGAAVPAGGLFAGLQSLAMGGGFVILFALAAMFFSSG